LLTKAAQERLAQEPTIPPKPAGSDESVAQFITRRLGQEALDNLIEPLMAGIYAGQVDQLSLAATFPQLRQLELKHGSLLKGLANQPGATNGSNQPPFVSFPGGMGQLVTRLVDCLQGVTIHRETAVIAIKQTAAGYLLSVNGSGVNGEQYPLNDIKSSAVIVTTPAYVSGRLLQGVDDELAGLLTGIPYASTALVNLVFNEADVPDLDGYGYVIPRVEGREALACTWSSRKWQDRAPDGKVLIRVYIGRFGEPDVTMYDDGRLLTIAQNEIRETLNITTDSLFHRIFRYPKSMPQYNLGHPGRLAAIEALMAAHPGLFLAGAAFNGVGIPDCIASGEEAAEKARGFLSYK
jgi:oxygen-dependent protoporphyrinogen oxidase